jgi:DTW domain-containing protein YfiP
VSTRRGSAPNRCPRCRVNHTLCFCDAFDPFRISGKVSLVVHVRELKLTTNTAQFVREMLPEDSYFDVRGHVEGPLDMGAVVARPGTPLFLYPHEGATTLTADFAKSLTAPYHLIVPDGSWQQARKVYDREPALQNVQCVSLPEGLVGEYRLRQARFPHWVSTYEAVAHALGVLEGEETKERLMALFRVFVQRVWKSRHDFHGKS